MREVRRQHRQPQRSLFKHSAASPVSVIPDVALVPIRSRSARRSHNAGVRGVFKSLMSIGAMAGVGALLVATSLPANAFQSAATDEEAAAQVAQTQTVVVESAAVNDVTRDTYEIVKPKPKPKPVAMRSSGVGVAAMIGSYTNNSGGSIQWPFPSSPITSGFGPRGGGFHAGIDFFPGEGTPIGSIADGVVTHTGTGAGGWGNYVTVVHNINGQQITSLYAHMQYGSIGVAVGQSVTVGTYLGAVGATGKAYGAHLHLEIRADGTLVDPYAWLKANAN